MTWQIETPNARGTADTGRDAYVPNPTYLNSDTAMNMHFLVGQLMGVSLRHNLTLPFAFPRLVWRRLLGQEPELDDLIEVDAPIALLLRRVQAAGEEELAALDLTFSLPNAAGEAVELIPGHASAPVNASSRNAFLSHALRARLHEFDPAVAAMRRGLGSVVPLHALALMTPAHIDELVAGQPEIDVERLKRHAAYEGWGEEHETVRLFWRVFHTFSDADKSAFIRFAWGRSRLPRGEDWDHPFKVVRVGGSTAALPHAHTCFFSIDLPEYTSESRMRSALLTCAHEGVGGILNA